MSLITVKFLGGSKKSFSTDHMEINQNDLSISSLIEHLLKIKPENTPSLDVQNIIIAVNGVDSSAIDGKETMLHDSDVISIIPIIHGGSQLTTKFTIQKQNISLIEIDKNHEYDINFLDEIRKKFPKLIIQAISSQFVLGKSHAKKLITLSLVAKKNDVMLSKKLETDLLLRFACTTQIKQAIQHVGIKKRQRFFLIIIGTKNELNKMSIYLKNDITSKPFLNNNKFLQKEFKISTAQLNAVNSITPLEDILVEKSAILF